MATKAQQAERDAAITKLREWLKPGDSVSTVVRHGSRSGMDMGFALVYNLGRTLFPEGFKVEGRGRNGDTSGHDSDGGYALKHRWL